MGVARGSIINQEILKYSWKCHDSLQGFIPTTLPQTASSYFPPRKCHIFFYLTPQPFTAKQKRLMRLPVPVLLRLLVLLLLLYSSKGCSFNSKQSFVHILVFLQLQIQQDKYFLAERIHNICGHCWKILDLEKNLRRCVHQPGSWNFWRWSPRVTNGIEILGDIVLSDLSLQNSFLFWLWNT